MSFVIIGPAEDTGGFFEICEEKYDTWQLLQLPMIDTEQEIRLHFKVIQINQCPFPYSKKKRRKVQTWLKNYILNIIDDLKNTVKLIF